MLTLFAVLALGAHFAPASITVFRCTLNADASATAFVLLAR